MIALVSDAGGNESLGSANGALPDCTIGLIQLGRLRQRELRLAWIGRDRRVPSGDEDAEQRELALGERNRDAFGGGQLAAALVELPALEDLAVLGATCRF
jgi:hypothetical protein